MRISFLSLFIFVTITLFGQVGGQGLILTQEQNENWFVQLSRSEPKDQIKLINKRLLSDTNVFIPNRYTSNNLKGERFSGYCKPIIVAGGTLISIENTTKISNIKRLTKLLNETTIKSIEIFEGEKATAIYGSRGECKVIIMSIEKKSTRRKFKKLEEKMNTETTIKEIRWQN